MNGLEEMVRRRGGFEEAGFSLDIKRLIGWYGRLFNLSAWASWLTYAKDRSKRSKRYVAPPSLS